MRLALVLVVALCALLVAAKPAGHFRLARQYYSSSSAADGNTGYSGGNSGYAGGNAAASYAGPAAQSNSGGYTGGQSNSGGYTGGQSSAAANSGGYTGGQSSAAANSGGYTGGQSSAAANSGGQSSAAANSGGYTGGQSSAAAQSSVGNTDSSAAGPTVTSGNGQSSGNSGGQTSSGAAAGGQSSSGAGGQSSSGAGGSSANSAAAATSFSSIAGAGSSSSNGAGAGGSGYSGYGAGAGSGASGNSGNSNTGTSGGGPNCPDGTSHCPSGYWCVANVLCLSGSPSDYDPAALVLAGMMIQLVEEQISASCIEDVEGIPGDLMSAFSDWQSGDSSGAMSSLTSAVDDSLKALVQCSSSGGFWGDIISIIKTALEYFAPEVVGPFEILVHGINIFEDFGKAMSACGASEWISCGEPIGDILYQVYEAVKLDQNASYVPRERMQRRVFVK